MTPKAGNPNPPHPLLACAICFYRMGFGYGRIANRLRIKRKRVSCFISLRVRKQGLEKGYSPFPKKEPVIKRSAVEKMLQKNASKNRRRRTVQLRRTVWRWLFRYKTSPISEEIVGCTRDQFIKHIESLFKRGMNWANYAKKWELDHIMPCKSFDLSDLEQIKKCFHFTNYRPLCAHENAVKSYKIITHQPELFL